MLPPWGRSVIFVDWHGVLSRDLFWGSITASARHPLRYALQEELAAIFAKDVTTAHEWMRGEMSSADIIEDMRVTLPARYGPDYLKRKLAADLGKVSINTELVTLLAGYRPDALVVVATDNMDCFATAFGRAKHRPRRKRAETQPPIAEFAACVARCDDILCSSERGTLKSEDPRTFFGPWLEQSGLGFSDAVLVDDRVDNCEAFAAYGGRALRWKFGTNPLSELQAGLEDWFAGPRHLTPAAVAS